MIPRNRRDFRAATVRARRLQKHVDRLSVVGLFWAVCAASGLLSRNKARRLLKAEAVRRYGKVHASYLGVRLPSVKDLVKLTTARAAP